MHIAVLSYSGNVGKSMIANELLLPRIPDAALLSVEVQNAQPDPDYPSYDPNRYQEILELLLLQDELVVDVGASCVDTFLANAAAMNSLVKDYDLFVIPVTPSEKVVRDTLLTVTRLSHFGVNPRRIVCQPNFLDRHTRMADVLEPLARLKAEGRINFRINAEAPIHANDVYPRLTKLGASLLELTRDARDYKAELRSEIGAARKAQILQYVAAQRLAEGAVRELDAAFRALVTGLPAADGATDGAAGGVSPGAAQNVAQEAAHDTDRASV